MSKSSISDLMLELERTKKAGSKLQESMVEEKLELENYYKSLMSKLQGEF
jgi:hypothetical protein